MNACESGRASERTVSADSQSILLGRRSVAAVAMWPQSSRHERSREAYLHGGGRRRRSRVATKPCRGRTAGRQLNEIRTSVRDLKSSFFVSHRFYNAEGRITNSLEKRDISPDPSASYMRVGICESQLQVRTLRIVASEHTMEVLLQRIYGERGDRLSLARSPSGRIMPTMSPLVSPTQTYADKLVGRCIVEY